MTPPSPLRRDRPVPLYHQLELVLRQAIELRELGDPDGRLPTEEELAVQYGVSRLTVRTALGRLEADGYIVRQRGKGTFVHPDVARKIERNPHRLLGFVEDVRRRGGEPHIEVLADDVIEAPLPILEALRLAPGSRVRRVRRLGHVGGKPLWLERRYYPPHVAERLIAAKLVGPSITNLLEEALGVRIESAHLRVEATAADAEQARLLAVRLGDPLLLNQFVFFDAAGRAVEMVRALFRADRYAFTFDLEPRAALDGDAPALPRLLGHVRA